MSNLRQDPSAYDDRVQRDLARRRRLIWIAMAMGCVVFLAGLAVLIDSL